ncbi:MAG: T9SS type A sorting domain-containing protein [candidate division WOR-3 bacterium]|nr:T9SS type A sorting domain-containing protein [candidate division WOR-3 bacterium]
MLNRIFEDNKKKVIGNVFCFALIHLFNLTTLFAQQTNNLEVIWVKTSPESVFVFGGYIASGDVNGDVYSDIMIEGDSVIDLMGSFPYRGKCWIFYGGPNMDTIPDVQLVHFVPVVFTGLHSADINSDGFSDVFLGSCLTDPEEVLVFLGGSMMDSTCDYRITPPIVGEFGIAISSGDVNGDGYKDLIVGASGTPPNPPGGWGKGRVYIYYGGPNFDIIPDVILNGGHDNDLEQFGSTVSSSGDVNDDGFDDIIIGARTYGWMYQGRIYIYFGGNPMDTIYDVAMMGEQLYETIGEFGIDFIRNYETFDYAVIGSPLRGPGPIQHRPGAVFVLFGGTNMDSITDIVMTGRTRSSKLGYDVSRTGYFLNQMFDGIIAGAPTEPYPPTDSNFLGCAYLWQGEPNFDTIPDAWVRGVNYEDYISAWNVASAGDIDGDGKDEVLVCWQGPSSFTGNRVLICKYSGLGIEERIALYAKRWMMEVYPNPVRSVLRVRCPWTVKEIKIYDVRGKIVKTLKADSRQNTEYREIIWDLRDENKRRLANGVYFVELVADQENEKIKDIRKIVITK